MAHFILEYSDNIPAPSLNLQALFESLHAAAEATGLFPLKGIRSRAYACHDYRMADGQAGFVFLHMTVLMGAGRSEAERISSAEAFNAVYQQHFAALFETCGVAMSFELKELEAVTRYNKNNIEDYLAS